MFLVDSFLSSPAHFHSWYFYSFQIISFYSMSNLKVVAFSPSSLLEAARIFHLSTVFLLSSKKIILELPSQSGSKLFH